MKHAIWICAIALFGTIGVALAQDAPKKETPTTKPAVNQFCAVNGEPEKIDPAVTYIYKDKTIGFCCESCIDEFKKDPEKYMKTLK
jgi:YHS domain-containing protein